MYTNRINKQKRIALLKAMKKNVGVMDVLLRTLTDYYDLLGIPYKKRQNAEDHVTLTQETVNALHESIKGLTKAEERIDE